MKLVKTLSHNREGVDYVVGDIHGNFYGLQKALDYIRFDPSVDRLISVGDLVDRGKESIKALEWLDKPWFHAVMGNHEDMAVKYFEGSWPENNYIDNGGSWFVQELKPIQELIVSVFKELPLVIEVETNGGLVGIVHAAVMGYDWERFKNSLILSHTKEHTKEHAIWSRDFISTRYYVDPSHMTETLITFGGFQEVSGVKAVVVGHTPMPIPVKMGNIYHIDTGGWHREGKFTFIRLDNMEIVQK